MMGRGRGRLPQRGRGRTNQENLDYAQFQQFIKFQKMSQQAIKEGSEAGSSDIDPPQKVIKINEGPGEPWKQVKGRTANPPKEKAVTPKIIEDIDQVLYPPGFSSEEYYQKNVVGKVFLRYCNYQEQFPIGNLIKEFTKPELLVVDNLWKAFSYNQKVEIKHAIIATLRNMRESGYSGRRWSCQRPFVYVILIRSRLSDQDLPRNARSANNNT